MDDPRPPPVAHPEELLALYVEGTGSRDERAQVEAHLASCAVCREEVAVAGAARAELTSLPEVDPQGVLSPQTAAWVTAHPSVSRPAGTRRPRRPAVSRGLASVAALAAAASLAGIFVVLARGGGGGEALYGSGARAPAQAIPANSAPREVIRSNVNHSRLSLEGLARRLARQTEAGAYEGAPIPAPPPVSPGRGGSPPPDQTRRALDCLAKGTGLDSAGRPAYLESSRFRGEEVYVGAFARAGEGGQRYLYLYAVRRARCDLVFSRRLSL